MDYTLYALLKAYIDKNGGGGNSASYDDSALKALITANADAIAILNGKGEGSVIDTATKQAALEVAKIVAGADESYDTLKEIADWIINDTTNAAGMTNDIAALKSLVGNTNVTTQIDDAIAAADLQSSSQVASAISEAVAAINYEEKGSADNALAEAKKYVDEKFAEIQVAEGVKF